MSFSNINYSQHFDEPKLRAMFKLNTNFGIRGLLWWQFVPGETIVVPWPSGEVRIKQEPSNIWDYVRSVDPNDLYRPELEAVVGKQYWDWDWRLYDSSVASDKLAIKFRNGKLKFASYFAMKWA